jgi:thiol-disulfide isomerase/thioredoxin
VRSRLLLAGVWAAAAWICGCAQSPLPSERPAESSAAPTASAPPAATTAEIKRPGVEILSWDQTQKRLEQFRGKIVVLDVWSTYCDPCVREFPNLVALQRRFADKVRCISFDTDYTGAVREPPESLRKPVLDFLSKHDASGLFNVISSDPSEDFYNKIHLGGPPAVFVYDQAGKLVKRFDNSQNSKAVEFTYNRDVFPLVEKLISVPR